MQKIKAHKQAFRRALRILYWVGLMILYPVSYTHLTLPTIA